MCHVWLKACWQYDQKWRKDFVLRFQLSTHISAFNLSRPTWMKQNSLDLKFSRAVWTFVQLQPINALSVSATVSAEVFCGTKKTLSLSPADSNWFIKEKGWDFSASPYCVHNLPFGSYRVIVFTGPPPPFPVQYRHKKRSQPDLLFHEILHLKEPMTPADEDT